MATRDIYETDLEEDVRTESCANHCSDCDGRVNTNAIKTDCEGYGLVMISGDTLRNIASQCGADDFERWCDWIDELLWRLSAYRAQMRQREIVSLPSGELETVFVQTPQ